MKNSFVIGLCVVVLLAGGLIGYKAAPSQGGIFGAAITYSQALNQQRLYSNFSNIATDLAAVRAPLAGVLTGSGTYTGTALGPVNTATSTATSTITVTGAVIGDGCFLGISTSTVNVAYTDCNVTAASVVTYTAKNVSATAIVPATSTVYATVLPRASFAAPTALLGY